MKGYDKMKKEPITNFRNNISENFDYVIRNKPLVISRRKDTFILSSKMMYEDLLENIRYTYTILIENDKSCSIFLNEIDLFDNGATKEKAIQNLAIQLLEYSESYYQEINLWYNSPNRKKHYPYIMKVLLKNSLEEVIGLLEEVQ